MTMDMKCLLAIALLLMPGPWKADAPASKVAFSVKGPFGMVHGTLNGLRANIDLDGKGAIEASVDVNTIKTGIGKRDRDLCNESAWFDAAKYPRITFVSHKITKTGNGYAAEGTLTIKGVAKPLTIPFTFDQHVFHAQFSLNREDYGLGKGPVGNLVTVDLVVAVRR
jgi:polyisoprenoid-binding protein YceI